MSQISSAINGTLCSANYLQRAFACISVFVKLSGIGGYQNPNRQVNFSGVIQHFLPVPDNAALSLTSNDKTKAAMLAASLGTPGRATLNQEMETCTQDQSHENYVQVEGEEISPEDFTKEKGWRTAGERHARRRQEVTATAIEGDDRRKAEKQARNTRISAIKAARMPAMPREETKIVVRPRGGIHVAKTGLIDVMAAIHLAAGITEEAGKEDTMCINAQQNIVVISTPKEENAIRYENIQGIVVRGNPHEVSAYRTTPHDTVKGVIRGIPLSETPRDIDARIVNERNPLALGAKRIGTSTAVIVAFSGGKVPYYVRYGNALIKCQLYRKQVDVCHQCGRVGHRKDVCPTPNEQACRGCGEKNPKEDHKCTPKCKLCGDKHLTGDRECRARYKTPYVIRKRQWERRKAEEQLTQEWNFPPLDTSATRKPRTPSRTSPQSRDNSKQRRQSRDNSTRRERSPSREKVTWADMVSATGGKTDNPERSTANKKQQKKSKEEEMIDMLRKENEDMRKENAELRAMIQQLTQSVNSLRRELTDIHQPTDQLNTNKVMLKSKTEASKGPAAKKRLIEEQEEKATIQDIREQLDQTIQRITETLEKKIQQQDNILAEMRASINQIMTPAMQQINQAQGNNYQSGQPWPPTNQA